MSRPRVLYIPTRAHTQLVFRPEDWERLCAQCDVTINESDRSLTSEEVAERIPGYDVLMTGWGSPVLTEAVFQNADRLRLIAHTAGSVRHMVAEDLVERYLRPRGIAIFSANGAIALNVAESAVGMLIMVGHHFYEHIRNFKETGTWKNPSIPWNTPTLNGSTIGVISASAVGREVMRLLRPFDSTLLLYDPFVSEAAAGELGARKADLNELFERSEYVTVHAPMLPETTGLIGKEQLMRMKPGAVLVNTSRGRVIDHAALLEVLRAGRIYALLDVTDPEPLPPDSPFRDLPNCFITPHISGAGHYGYFKIGETARRAVEDFFAGRTPAGLVPLDRYSIVA